MKRTRRARPMPSCCISVWAICTWTSSATRTPPPPTAPTWRAIPTAITRRIWRCRRSRPTARAASASWCSMASTSSSSTTTSTRPSGRPASRADYPQVVQELKINLKDVATYFHATAQKIQAGGRLPGGGPLVPRLPEVIPGRSRFGRDQLPAGRGAVREPSVRRRRHRVRAHRLRLSEERQVRDRRLRRHWCPTRKAKRACRAPRSWPGTSAPPTPA